MARRYGSFADVHLGGFVLATGPSVYVPSAIEFIVIVVPVRRNCSRRGPCRFGSFQQPHLWPQRHLGHHAHCTHPATSWRYIYKGHPHRQRKTIVPSYSVLVRNLGACAERRVFLVDLPDAVWMHSALLERTLEQSRGPSTSCCVLAGGRRAPPSYDAVRS